MVGVTTAAGASLAGVLGLATAFLMVRQPDVVPSADIEGVALG